MLSPAGPRTVLTGGRVVRPTGVHTAGRVTVEAGLILPETDRLPETNSPPETDRPPDTGSVGDAGDCRAVTTVDLSGHWVLPGFVDTHVHGGGGAAFSAGMAEEALRAVHAHRRHGTTTMVASTVTAPLRDLVAQAGALADLVEQGDLAGVHFEGPFLARGRCGAHDPALLRDPDPAAVRSLLTAARGTAAMLTLAPELPGGIDAVRLLRDSGVVAAVGHTDAPYETTREAVAAGARVATHLFNAMPPFAHRAPGPVGALLEDERVTVELINDGVHLHRAALALAVRAAGPSRVTLVTDAMAAAGLGDGRYRLGPREVAVADGVARLTAAGSPAGHGALAGSTLTLDRAVHRTVAVDRLPMPDVVRAVSTTPARLLGLDDRIGSIEAGKDADLVVMDDDLALTAVMRKGTWVVPPPADRVRQVR